MNDRPSDKTTTLDPQRAPENQSGRAPWAMGEPAEAAFTQHAEADVAPHRRLNEGLLLLALVVAVAGGALWLMRAGGSASVDHSSAAAEAKIEAALAQLAKAANPASNADNPLGSLPENSDQIIAIFLADPTARQVKLNQLKNNPFAMLGAHPDRAATPLLSVDPVEQQRIQHLQKLRGELSHMQLQTVMQGRVPLAVISGAVVRQGQTIGSFTIAAIEARSVVLTADGNTYRIDMIEPLIGNALTD